MDAFFATAQCWGPFHLCALMASYCFLCELGLIYFSPADLSHLLHFVFEQLPAVIVFLFFPLLVTFFPVFLKLV